MFNRLRRKHWLINICIYLNFLSEKYKHSYGCMYVYEYISVYCTFNLNLHNLACSYYFLFLILYIYILWTTKKNYFILYALCMYVCMKFKKIHISIHNVYCVAFFFHFSYFHLCLHPSMFSFHQWPQFHNFLLVVFFFTLTILVI